MEYGLIGEKLTHSYSKLIHDRLGAYEYTLISLGRDELADFMAKRAFKGLNVTIPYKKAVMAYCDELSPEARRIGSVNTLVVRNGRLIGYNTDYDGLSYIAGRAGIDFKGARVLLLGSGGTSATAAALARDMGADRVVAISRSGAVDYQSMYAYADSSIIINTTPVGMYPNNGGKLIEIERFPSCRGVLDVIYNPLLTELLMDARARHIPYSGGLPMLVAQAKYSSDLFLGKKDDQARDRIERVTRALTDQIINIVLIGMPGSGKTSIAERIATETGKAFIDTDEQIVRRENMSVEEIFKLKGEAGFRAVEKEVVAQIGKEKGAVIATGGGAVLDPDNIRALKQNGFIIFIARDLDKLDVAGRPLSSGGAALEGLYRRRERLYRAYCDAMIDNDATLDEAVQKAADLIRNEEVL